MVYNTFASNIFDVPKYAKALNEIAEAKSIELKLLRNLKAVNIAKQEAAFEILGIDGKPTGELEIQKVPFFFF